MGRRTFDAWDLWENDRIYVIRIVTWRGDEQPAAGPEGPPASFLPPGWYWLQPSPPPSPPPPGPLSRSAISLIVIGVIVAVCAIAGAIGIVFTGGVTTPPYADHTEEPFVPIEPEIPSPTPTEPTAVPSFPTEPTPSAAPADPGVPAEPTDPGTIGEWPAPSPPGQDGIPTPPAPPPQNGSPLTDPSDGMWTAPPEWAATTSGEKPDAP